MSSNVSSALAYLIDELLPTKLRAVECDGAAAELIQVWRDPGSRTHLISALQEAADAALECSIQLDAGHAHEAEQVSLLALHLVRCIELGGSSTAQMHLLRALEIGRSLGLPHDKLAS